MDSLDPALTKKLKDGYLTNAQNTSLSEIAEILQVAKQFSVAPISGFHVGACAIGASGNIYIGANMEFSGAPLSASLHAEQSALVNAWMHGENEITDLHVTEAPCGHCRQFLRELNNESTIRIHTQEKIYLLADLLPDAFVLDPKKNYGLLNTPPHKLEAIHSTENNLLVRALNAAQLSYVPYTLNPEGCILECSSGQLFSGRTAESAAYNPTVNAVICALNQRNLSSHREEAILSAHFAKLATGIQSQASLNKAILSSITNVVIETLLFEFC